MAKKKQINIIILIIIGVVVISLIGLGIYMFSGEKTTESLVNEGVALKLYSMDKYGKILQEIAEPSRIPTQSIIAEEVAKGYAIIDNVNTFLAIGTQLDNSAGNTEITATDAVGSNPCNIVNLNPGCAGITNIFGPGGANRGNLNAKWDPSLPLLLTKGAVSQQIVSDGMSLAPIELGLIDFRVDVTGTYLDKNELQQPLQNVFGKAVLKISTNTCTDGTAVDPDSSNADVSQYCSTVNKGKYCRVGSSGEGKLTDKASLCGCPTNYQAIGEICQSLTCGNTWSAGSCDPDGGVLYCKSDGSVESRCNQCTFAKCPKSVNGDNAIGCSPSGSGEPSTCVYPTLTNAGFLVKVIAPNIPIVPACGDGIKEGAEQCDKFDFSRESCRSRGYQSGILSCSVGCTYVETGCTGQVVRFRTTDLAYGSSTGVAYATSCGNRLKSYGKTDTLCSNHDCSATDQTLNVPTATATTKMWYDTTTDKVCICNAGQTTGYSKRYSSADSDAGSVSTSSIPTGTKELNC